MDLVSSAHLAGRDYTASRARDSQRALGQYMTPPRIAEFMARQLLHGVDATHVRLLEPGAGSGVLLAAAVDRLLRAPPSRMRSIEALVFEIDPALAQRCRALCVDLEAQCAARGIVFQWQVECTDFLLSDLAIRGQPVDGLLTLANPPFLKLNKATDPRAALHAYAVYGQPNLYGLFMAACARLTGRGGRWCFIAPRSWTSGPYFRAVRHTLRTHLTLSGLHAFESRTDSFGDDAVLQETVIAWAHAHDRFEPAAAIAVTSSHGASDVDAKPAAHVPADRVYSATGEILLPSVPGAADALGHLHDRLHTHGLAVSTGPVVAFRAEPFIRERRADDTVPLLWMQHVRQQRIAWPVDKKREHIRVDPLSRWMLVENMPMVLMRRFSPKEDTRRVTCAAYDGHLCGSVVGLENHLNYVHRPGGRMGLVEVRGLAAWLACGAVDRWLRALAGSTQVNATDLRKLPLPSAEAIQALGEAVGTTPSLAMIDAAVTGLGLVASHAEALA